jgi:hypothetical protein
MTRSFFENAIVAVLLGLAVLMMCVGCSVKQAEVIKPDGTVVRVTINSILTSERSEGLSYGRVDGEVMLELGPMGADPEAEQLGAILGAAIKEATR